MCEPYEVPTVQTEITYSKSVIYSKKKKELIAYKHELFLSSFIIAKLCTSEVSVKLLFFWGRISLNSNLIRLG